MTTIRIETVPQTWTDSDTAFFTIVARLFTPDFTYGAGVLLAGLDTDSTHGTEVGTVASALAVPTPAADIVPAVDRRALVPVVVRRMS